MSDTVGKTLGEDVMIPGRRLNHGTLAAWWMGMRRWSALIAGRHGPWNELAGESSLQLIWRTRCDGLMRATTVVSGNIAIRGAKGGGDR